MGVEVIVLSSLRGNKYENKSMGHTEGSTAQTEEYGVHIGFMSTNIKVMGVQKAH